MSTEPRACRSRTDVEVAPRMPYAVHLALGMGTGVFLAASAPHSAQTWLLPAVLLCAVGVGVVRLCGGLRLVVFWVLVGLSLGAVRMLSESPSFMSDEDLRWHLSPWPESLEIEARGVVVSGQRRTASGWQAEVALSELRARGSTWCSVNGRLRLRWREEGDALLAGSLLHFAGSVMEATPKRHPWDFDAGGVDARARVAATVRLEGGLGPRVTGLSMRIDRRLYRLVDRFRIHVEERLLKLEEQRSIGWILAVGTGTRAELDPAERDLMVASGTAHLLAVSGLHLAILVLSLARLFEWLVGWLRIPLFYRERRFYGALVTIPLAWVFVIFTGAGTAVVRAALFLSLLSVADMLRRPRSSAGALGATVVVILMWNPHELFGASFQLSLSAVAGILAANSIRGGSRSRGEITQAARSSWLKESIGRVVRFFRAAFRVSLAAGLTTAPILAWHFGVVSTSTVVSNVLVAPLFALVLVAGSGITLGLAAVEPWLASLSASLCGHAIDCATWILRHISEVFRDPLTVGRPHWLEAVAWCLAVAALPLALGRRAMRRSAFLVISLMITLVIVMASMRLAAPRDLEVWFLPVGQGDAVLLRTPSGHNVLVDTGGSAFGVDPGRGVVVPILRGLGLRELDLIVISHAHFDHLGGLEAILETYPPFELWWTRATARSSQARALVEQLSEAGVAIRYPAAEQRHYWLGATRLEVLHPREGIEGGLLPLSINDGSLTLRVVHGERAILLSGDLERMGETMLVHRHGLGLVADILKVPHHGSPTSSSSAFLGQVLPQHAVFSVGIHNSFGFPHASIEHRYRAFGVRTYRTDLDGLVRFVVSHQGIEATVQRVGRAGRLNSR